MSIVEKILSDEVCINYAKKIGGSIYEDIFNDAIEKVIQLESKGKVFNSGYKSYFYLMLVSANSDYYRKLKIKTTELKSEHKNTLQDVEVNSYQKALDNFLNNIYEDRKIEMSRVLTELSLTLNKKEIAQKTGCSLPFIYQYLDIAKKQIKYEHDRIIHY